MLESNKARLMYTGLLAAAVAWGAPGAGAAHAEAMQAHVPGWTAGAAKVGTAPEGQSVEIAVHMALKNTAGLKSFVADVSKPGSEHYGQYLSPVAFGMRFAPAKADVTAVTELLKKAGMTNLVVGPNGVYVTATATVGQLTRTFGVTQDLYAFKGKTIRASKREPTLPAALAGKVAFIEGLDDTPSLKQPLHQSAVMGDLVAPAASTSLGASSGQSSGALTSDAASATAAASAVTPPPVASNLPSAYCDTYFGDLVATLSTKPAPYSANVPWLVCGYTPQQIQAAYGLNKVKYDGKGVTIGIIDAFASPTLKADGNRYAANHGLPKLTAANFSEIIPQGIYNVPAAQVTNAYGWWGEQSLDLAAVHGAAPGAKIVYIGATDNGMSLDVALMNAIYNKQADILTNSYSFNGEGVSAAQVSSGDQAFMAAAAMGITLLFSSGDSGDLSVLNGVATGAYESTSPYVTGVGGTSLALKNAKGAKSEYGWGNYRDNLAGVTVNSGTSVTTSGLVTTTAFGVTFSAFAYYAGAGGGISLIEPQPDYQASVVPASLSTVLNEASGNTVPVSPHRVAPDVAMVADPYTGYLIGETFTIAGNSVADAGCVPTSGTQEYCEIAFGGTSLASPLMAGVVAVMNQKRIASGEPVVGFANPLFYSYGSGPTLTSAGLNQIKAPTSPVAVLRGYVNDLTRIRVVTINSVPYLIDTAPYALQVCAQPICEGVNEIFNYTSVAADDVHGITTPPGYNDVAGLGVPWVPNLIQE